MSRKIDFDTEYFLSKRRLPGVKPIYHLTADDRRALESGFIRMHRLLAKSYARRLVDMGILKFDDRLSPREKKILELRYIYLMTLEEVGKEFGVTRERIREIEKNALLHITNSFATAREVKDEQESLNLI